MGRRIREDEELRGIDHRPLRRADYRRSIRGGLGGALVLLPVILLLVAGFAVSAGAGTPATCATARGLNTGGSNSNFEIDTNANLRSTAPVRASTGSPAGPAPASGPVCSVKSDKPTGKTDDAFGQGSKEDSPNPTIVAGSIPHNKSDLKAFGTYQEASSPQDLELFWSRVQQPEGTTNMDFELNQKFCSNGSNCANNGRPETPQAHRRRQADHLRPRQRRNDPDHLDPHLERIRMGRPDGDQRRLERHCARLGQHRLRSRVRQRRARAAGPFTFGEAAISFEALFGGSNGVHEPRSAYLKSRASDSFTAELKDFIAPLPVTSPTAHRQHEPLGELGRGGRLRPRLGELGNATANAGGTVTYTVYSDASCSQNPRDAGTKSVSNGIVPDSNDLVFNTAGTFYWQASYSGDADNLASTSPCTSEVLVVALADPLIAIVKDPDSQTIASGGTAEFSITVTNTGERDAAQRSRDRCAGRRAATGRSGRWPRELRSTLHLHASRT